MVGDKRVRFCVTAKSVAVSSVGELDMILGMDDGGRMKRTDLTVITLAVGTSLAALAIGPAQARDEFVIVAPSCGPYNLSLCKDPAERARNEARKKQLDAQKEAAAQAAEEARLKREADIKGIMKAMNLGPGQEADARRLYEMRQAAQAAMPKPPGAMAQASTPKPVDPKVCPNTRPYDEVVQVTGLRQPSQAMAMASLSANAGVYDTQCSGNDFGWQCTGKRKTGKTLYACVGSAAQ